ncbi:MAG: type I-D CRISPR-associated protein Cas5/Csc1 [Chloroflexota bacterium]|nr:MAG: type I-D CRISPR-associated protein Cas5/Csc1 [Chloroflexota bacterium]
MLLYECQLEFHDNLFYETRTLGRLYETGRLLHNIALCYALGLAQTPFYHSDDVPRYDAELAAVNEAGIYVTPAGALDIHYVISTFKYGAEQNYAMMAKSNRNVPTYGRAKEIGVNSRFRFLVLAEQPVKFPDWIRMGIWLSKARLMVSAPHELRLVHQRRTETIRAVPLNPADLPAGASVNVFDLVSMRPTSLIENAELHAESWWVWTDAGGTNYLPAGMRHNVLGLRG